MVVTEKVKFPDDSELTVQEINVTYPVLQAASFYVGKKCEWQSNEFMLCREEEKDARRCINEGKALTACALDFFKQLKKHCREDFEQYVTCLEKSSGTIELSKCRKTQAVVDKCVLDNLKIERPPFGYFCETKVHDSSRPRPKPDIPEFPDALPPLPKEKPEIPGKFGSRHFFN
ncbi:NADH dehydrogenase [ubiquinone] 1 alpha subcomplex subunit 8 [Vespa velutina]|uniref:NADH dehydrogenase [ubiquinone] 1 alpha subcomplex subunit 8 n=1 Tax=Vespa velutina TaxID=202808 RepID=UPI001FB3530F|nr:NADH dehydrogenase [ubiquinone] 1 alpha subcomplex subunit 8 [Vespa velutina]